MSKRITMRSNKRDVHGEVFTTEALESMIEQMNDEKKIAYTMNHRRELPPIGRIVDGRMEIKGDYKAVTGEIQLYEHRKIIDWDDTLYIEHFNNPTPFNSAQDRPLEKPSLSFDPNNFLSFDAYFRFEAKVKELNPEVVIEGGHMRKSDIPFPEMIFGIAASSVLGQLLRFTVEKLSEKLIEDGYDSSKTQLKKFRDYLVGLVRMTRNETYPKNKVLTTILECPGEPHIELIIKSDNPDHLSKGLNENRLEVINQEIEKFSKFFAIAKIQFILTDKGRWKFNYLLTKQGEAVGKKLSFKERDKQYQRYLMMEQESRSEFSFPNPNKNRLVNPKLRGKK